MRRALPLPGTSATIAVAWLLLGGPSPGQVLLAALFAIVIPLFARRFMETRVRLRGPRAALAAARLALLVTWDIVRANVSVAALVLGPSGRLRPAFVEVPLELAQPLALSLLATIVSITPGTVSAHFSEDRRRLLVHALHADDPAHLAADIKARYERALMEIFQ
jgi:multicomponent K+:H+ antiporter subunit E